MDTIKYHRIIAALRFTISIGIRRILPCAFLTPLIACFGGGGGGSSSNGLSNNPSASFFGQAAEPSAPFATTDWSLSQEYLNSTGLAQLKAAEGYARRTGGLPGGQGVRIAIIDSGIDLTHPDLGNLSGQSWSAGGEDLVGDAHGTFVAGIAAASRTQTADANDMHGLAYLATLVNFQASRPSTGNTSFATSDLVLALNAAAGLSSGSSPVESDIFNLSLGAFSTSDSTFGSLRTAMRAAADEDKIMVLAAGNEGLDADPTRKLQPIYPAAYADDSGIAGLAIVVGNLTSSNQAASSSNHCGDTKNYCLFAPGTNIRSTLNGGSYGIGSGTSFAAPYVTGAAAVVKAAFPGVSSQDVVNRLLLTTQDLGDPGVDDTFGRGLLDLEAAMAPVGPVGLILGPTVASASNTTSATSLDLGQAWSIGNQGKALLQKAVGFDRMGFPFPVDLSERVTSARTASSMRQFVEKDRTSSAHMSWSQTRLAVSITDQPDHQTEPGHGLTYGDWQSEPVSEPHLAFRAEPIDNVTLFAAINGSSKTSVGLQQALQAWRFELFGDEGTLTPFDPLSGLVSGGGFVLEAGGGFEIAVSAFTRMPDEDTASTSTQKIEFAKSVGDHVELRLGLGLLQQKSGFLGNSAKGAFGETMDSHSQFADLSIVASLTDRIDWFGAYSRGHASVDHHDGSLLSNWSSIQADAFATGISIEDVSTKGDSFSLMVGQPLRGDRANVTLTVPVGRTPEGEVLTEKERIDLAPSSREIASNLLYRRAIGRDKNQEIGIGGFARFHTDHDANNAPAFGFGMHYRWQF